MSRASALQSVLFAMAIAFNHAIEPAHAYCTLGWPGYPAHTILAKAPAGSFLSHHCKIRR